MKRFLRRFRRISRLDMSLVRRSGQLPPTPADDGLRLLGMAANHSKLWFVIAGLLVARKGATRRAGLRGVAAIAGASFSASFVGKRLFPRRRPAADLLPTYRRLHKRPTSSSFPSGHSASAAAFAAAVAMEHRIAGAVLLPLAAAVGYSRVHTGVHWPSDVAAGTAIGVGAAYATRHWWPHQASLPAGTQQPTTVPALGDGDGLVVVVNPASGSGNPLADQVTEVWPQAEVIELQPDTDAIENLVTRVRQGVRAIGVVGGDGTVASVAEVAVDHGLPLVVLPGGTLNHFARDVGVETIDDALAATKEGSAILVDVAEVTVAGERLRFINTASIGGYPETVRLREKLEAKWPKPLAALLASARTLRSAKPLPIMLNGRKRLVWMLFVGNGAYEPKGFGAARRLSLSSGLLDVRYLRADLPYSRVRFLLAVLTGTLHASHVYRHAEVRAVEVRILGNDRTGSRRLALDGEVGPLANHFTFRIRSGALTVYRS